MPDQIEKNKETELEVMPSFDFVINYDKEQQTRISDHRVWLNSIKHELPLPKHHFKVAIYIRYFNQTRYDDYLAYHKQQFSETIALCPNWEFIGFYVDEGATAPSMETAQEWSRLLNDCYAGKVDLIITQKVSNISKKITEISFCARILAVLDKPVGVYFISEDIYTLASYYQNDLRDPYFLPSPDSPVLSDDNSRQLGMQHD